MGGEMKKKILMGLVAALLATGCVPLPSQTTTVVYEAQGPGAATGSGGGCTGVAWSYYRFNLDDPGLPMPAWRTKPEEIRVSVLPKDDVLEVIFTGWSTRSRKSIDFDASDIRIRLDGKPRQPRNSSEKRYTDFMWGSSLSLEIDIGTDLPATVTLDAGRRAVVVDGKAFPLPGMTFRRVTRTTTMLTRPLNC